jgi:hypothetical protein
MTRSRPTQRDDSADPTSFAAELDAFTEELVTGEVGNFRYLIHPEGGGTWTVRDDLTGKVVGEPHDDKGAAIEAALDLNR